VQEEQDVLDVVHDNPSTNIRQVSSAEELSQEAEQPVLRQSRLYS
jgi:hypothetical protein